MKHFLAFVCALFLIGSLSAQNTAASSDNGSAWDFISVGICPDYPDAVNYIDTYGVKLGIPMAFGSKALTVGVEASMIAGFSEQVYGVQTAPFFVSTTHLEGLQFSIVNCARKVVYGLQLGVVNYSTDAAFQIGIVNIIKNSSIPFLPVINVRF